MIKYGNMIDASQIYKLIKAYASLDDKVFCDLHKCADANKCELPQHHFMLNFDNVKDTYCRNNKLTPCKSADGLSYNNNGILFLIEIKGWNLYKEHDNPQSEQKVKDKVDKYRLAVKLTDSLNICKNVLPKVETITVPIVYLVVSDIRRNEGLESIENNLALLAETSSDLSNVYEEEIKSQLSLISDIDYGFVENCQQIDQELNSWIKAREVQLV